MNSATEYRNKHCTFDILDKKIIKPSYAESYKLHNLKIFIFQKILFSNVF